MMHDWTRCSWPCRSHGEGRFNNTPAGCTVCTRASADVVIYDYVDDAVPVLARMYRKRLAGYRAMGYTVADAPPEAEPAMQDRCDAPRLAGSGRAIG